MKFKLLSYLPIFLYVVFGIAIGVNICKWEKKEVLKWDMCGYHNYLPAMFIYDDLAKFEYYNKIDSIYSPTGNTIKRYALLNVKNSNKVCNQYPVGVSIFQSFSFFIANNYAKSSNKFEPDGYSLPYQLAVFLNTFLFSLFGLLILRNFLLSFFKDWVVFFVLIILSFGTNFFNYSILEPGLSHPYLFFLYSSVLYLTYKWHIKATWRNSILLGLCIGGCIILRPLDILIFIIPLMWYKNFNSLGEKLNYVKINFKYLISIIIFAFLATLPQIIYWEYATGKMIYYSYSDVDYFEFDRFRVFHGLFSFRRGWFIYSPLLIFGFFGTYYMWKYKEWRGYLLLFWAYFIPMIYITFSWHNWFYGWGYSCRALMQTIPVLALPLGLLINQISKVREAFKVLLFEFVLLLISLNIFQNWQYTHGILHGTDMNFKYYRNVFLKTSINEEDKKILYDQTVYDWIHKW